MLSASPRRGVQAIEVGIPARDHTEVLGSVELPLRVVFVAEVAKSDLTTTVLWWQTVLAAPAEPCLVREALSALAIQEDQRRVAGFVEATCDGGAAVRVSSRRVSSRAC